MKHFSIRLWHSVKSGLFTIPVDDQFSCWTKKKLQSTSQSQTQHQKEKGHGHWWSAAGLIHYSFLNLGNTITSEKYAQQIDEMHQKLQCLQPALVNSIGSILLHNNTQTHVVQSMLQKLNKLGYEVFASSATFTWLLTNWLQLLQESQQPAGGRKCFQEFVESQNMDFYATGINKIISH